MDIWGGTGAAKAGKERGTGGKERGGPPDVTEGSLDPMIRVGI